MKHQKPPSAQELAEQRALDAVRATRRAWLAVWVSVGGWCVGVLGAALVARDPELRDLRWGLAGGSIGGKAFLEMPVPREWVVPLAVLVMVVPIAMAVVGVRRTAALVREPPRWDKPRPSSWCTAAIGAVVALVPNLLGCYVLSAWFGSSDMVVFPMFWPQLTFLGYIGASMWRWESKTLAELEAPQQKQNPPTRRTLSGKRVPVRRR